MHTLNESILAAAIDAWERYEGYFEDPPYESFRAARPTEAKYLWLLARGFAPPRDPAPGALQNLITWGLITRSASVTTLGRRFLATAKAKLAADPFAGAGSGTW